MTGAVPAAARRRRCSPARTCARGTRSGATATAHIVVENGYVDRDATASCGSAARRSTPTACSRSATRATTAARRSTRGSASSRRDLDSLRHAFQIDDYPVSGLLSGEFHLTGEYEQPDRLRRHDDRRRRRRTASRSRRRRRRCGSTAPACGSTASTIAKGGGTRHRRRVRRLGLDLFVQRRRPADSGRADRRASAIPRAPLSGLAEFTASGSGDVRRAALRRPVPHQRSVRRRGRRRAGDRHAGAARQGAERRGRRGVAAPRDHRHRPHRADAAGRRRADVPLPRQLARSVRPAVRAAAVAVHDGRRQRLDPRRRRARRTSIICSSTAPSTRSTCGCSTTRCRTPRRSASRSISTA